MLGTGGMGMRHLAILEQTGSITSIAVPKRPERVVDLAARGLATAKNLREAHSMGATLCIVATDTGQHYQDGLTAIEIGLDILMEKPLAENASNADLPTDVLCTT